MGDRVPLDEVPQAPGVGGVGGAVVEDHRGAVDEGGEDEPRAHHPPHVGHPVDDIARLDVHRVGGVLRGLDGEAAVRVDGALGPPGRAARVEEHRDVFGSGSFERRVRQFTGEEIVPRDVAPVAHRHIEARAADDDHRLARRHIDERGVGDGLHRDGLSAPEHAVGGDERAGACVGEAARDGVGAVAGEQRKRDGADAERGEEGDEQLGHHRQEQPDDIALADPLTTERLGAALHLGVEVGVRERLRGAVLLFVDERSAGGGGVVRLPAVEARRHDVHLPADAPARERGVAGVFVGRRVGRREGDAEVAEDGVPEPRRVVPGALGEALDADLARAPRERADGALGHVLRVGPPDDLLTEREERGAVAARSVVGRRGVGRGSLRRLRGGRGRVGHDRADRTG